MDIQVLNEIANPARQAALSQVSPPVSANAQLKALKGNTVPVPGSPASLTIEDPLEQNQDPVTPNISPVARAASDYSAVVGDGLNSDELSAIQDLAGRVRTAVSNFLNQPGVEQAENVAAVVASNPEAVQDLTSSLELAVVETLNLPGSEAEFNNEAQVIAANPAPVNSRVSENTTVENPVKVEEVPESSRGDFRVTAASPERQNALPGEHAPVQTPVSPPEEAVVPQQEPVSRPDAVAASSQKASEAVASPVSQRSVPTGKSAQVETPVSPVVATPSQEPKNLPETVATNHQEVPVTSGSAELQNAPAQKAEAGNPVTVPPPNQGQGLEENPAQAVNPVGSNTPLAGAVSQLAPEPTSPQSASTTPPSGPAHTNDLFAQESAAVNPESIRDVNELVNSVVDNEFTSEAKKIFSEPKVIRTVADLADFILERLKEIIAAKQQQPQSNGETAIS